MTRERALILYDSLLSGLGQSPQISESDYCWLMENSHFITPSEKANYVTRIVRFLRENHSCLVPDVENYNEGDRIEHWLGIPRNNSPIGDLFGLELKSWNGKTDIRFKTSTTIFPAAKNRMQIGGVDGWNIGDRLEDYIFYPKFHHPNLSDQERKHRSRELSEAAKDRRPLFLLKTGDNFRNGVPNQWGRVRLDVNDDDEIQLRVRSGLGRWMLSEFRWPLREVFQKFERGLVIVQRKLFNDRALVLQSTEVLLGVNTNWCIQQFRDGEMCLQARLKTKNGVVVDPGQGFQFTYTQIDNLRYRSALVEQDRSINWECPITNFE